MRRVLPIPLQASQATRRKPEGGPPVVTRVRNATAGSFEVTLQRADGGADPIEDVQVVISDWLMPNMDGPSLCRLVRSERRPRYTYFILLTILQGKENKLQGMEAGADDFISKPFDPDELAARLVAASRVLELRYEVAQLERLLPICCYCRKIRDDDNGWLPVEEYIAKHTGTDFSHGICPHCYEEVVRPELGQLTQRRRGDGPAGSGGTDEQP